MILLISTDDVLVRAFVKVLHVSTPFIYFNTVTEAQAYLHILADDNPKLTLLVVDAKKDQQLVAECYRLCQKSLTYDVPIIAIINRPLDRQIVLESGADDYLLHPFVPAEVQVRLANYFRSASHSLNIWIEAFYQMNKGVSQIQVLNQSLKDIAQIFNAPAVCLFLADSRGHVNLLGSYNLPPFLQQNPTILDEEGKLCLNVHHLGEMIPQIIPVSELVRANQQTHNELTHYLSIPLNCQQQLIGILNLAYTKPPQISQTEQRTLVMLAQDLGTLLKLFHLQEEAQMYAAQNAFMVLMARTMNERLDLNTILALSLEQAVPLLNASGGEIWLLTTDDEQALELVSALSATPVNHSLTQRPKAQGLIGWVAEYNQSLHTKGIANNDPRFDPRVDRINGTAAYSLLAVPLRHHETTIGVLAMYNNCATPFTNPDSALLEGIANLTAPAIANARLMQELRDHADQQRALYEMSKQIAAGLDLKATLNRVLLWVGRLFQIEVSLLWLAEESTNKAETNVSMLQLVAVWGVELPQKQAAISLEQGIIGWVVRTGKAAMINNPSDDPRFEAAIINKLGIKARNVIFMPMIYHGQTIGVVAVFNKIGGGFNKIDLTLLSIAIEMAAVTVGNARLHTQTVSLMNEHERLHKQIVQTERLATVGRLTASLSHEINNPMQAIRTALSLAQESGHNPQDLDTYIQIGIQESERVIQLIKRMSQIYRPQSDSFETLDVNRLLQEVITIADKELKRQQVTLEVNLSPKLPPLTAIANQLHLVFLSLILNLSDTIGLVGGGQLQLQSLLLPQAVQIKFASNVSIVPLAAWIHGFVMDSSKTKGTAKLEEGISFGLSFSHEIIVAHGGTINFSQQDEQTIFHIELPLSNPNLIAEPENQLLLLT